MSGQSDQAAKIPWAHLRIPAFPKIAIRVLQVTNNEDVSIRQLGDLISFDPSFASEVLTVANSALYAPRVPVTSILQAMAVLGLNRLRGVCLTVGIRAYLGKSLNRLSLRAIWRHSLACALKLKTLRKRYCCETGHYLFVRVSTNHVHPGGLVLLARRTMMFSERLLDNDAVCPKMILPTLRTDLDMMPSPISDRPGLLIRDRFRYSDATLIIPPSLIPGLLFFDGRQTNLDLQAVLARSLGNLEIGNAVGQLLKELSQAGFLQDEIYAKLKHGRISAFAESPVRQAAHAGSAYPGEIGPLRNLMQQYLEGAVPAQQGVMGIAAPHVSPQCGWQSYRAAYKELTPDLQDRTFVVLGTSHYGQPDKFGLTRKPFETPFGRTRIDRDPCG